MRHGVNAMPVTITRMSGGRYEVRTPSRVHAKGTTREKAEKQARLLRAVEHNPTWQATRKERKR